jgi:prevent-host-death family protein
VSKTVNMHDAKTHLSRLVQELRDGEEREVIIAVSGKPCARLVPFAPKKRVLGIDRGFVSVGPNFDAADEEIAALFNASPSSQK